MVVLVSLLGVSALRAEDDRPDDVRCGIMSLYVALKAIDLGPASFEEFEKKAGAPGPYGYSMYQLDELAKGAGAQTIAVDSSLEKLRARKEAFTCIALLKRGHFVVLHDLDDQTAHIVDPPSAKRVPIDTFRQSWTKKALLIGRDPFQPEESVRLPIRWGRAIGWGLAATLAMALILAALAAIRRRVGRRANVVGRLASLLALAVAIPGCQGRDNPTSIAPKVAEKPKAGLLVLEPAEHRLGDVLRTRPDATMDVKTTLRNVGDGPLKIEKIQIGCTCTAASLSRDLIPPGETATLLATIKVGDSPLNRDSSLILFNSSPTRPAMSLGFRWRSVNQIRVEPASCDWPKLARGESTDRSLDIVANGIGLCPKCRIEFTSATEDLAGEISGVSGTRSGHGTTPETSKSRTIARLNLRARGSGELGLHRQESLVAVRCGAEDRARVGLPISWTVTTALAVSPERISLGACRAGDRVERKVILISDGDVAFRVARVSCEQDGVVEPTNLDRDAKPRHLLDVAFTIPRVSGVWRVNLIVETDREGARRAVVPVSALVEASP